MGKKNPMARPIRCHPSLGIVVSDIWTSMQGVDQPSLSKFNEIVGKALSDCLDASWIRFDVCVGNAADDTDSLLQSVVGIFNTIGGC